MFSKEHITNLQGFGNCLLHVDPTNTNNDSKTRQIAEGMLNLRHFLSFCDSDTNTAHTSSLNIIVMSESYCEYMIAHLRYQ